MTEVASPSKIRTFFDAIVQATPGDAGLERCIQCGTCGGSCPSGPDMEHTPRTLFALINAGMKDKVLKSNSPWYCVSCYYCIVRCPQDIHVTDIMYTIKRFSIRSGLSRQSTAQDAPGFSQDFISNVENYGRSFELGLATRYHLKYHALDMPKMVPMALGMLRKDRMDLTPKRIKNINSLKAILKKAKEIEEQFFVELEV